MASGSVLVAAGLPLLRRLPGTAVCVLTTRSDAFEASLRRRFLPAVRADEVVRGWLLDKPEGFVFLGAMVGGGRVGIYSMESG